MPCRTRCRESEKPIAKLGCAPRGTWHTALTTHDGRTIGARHGGQFVDDLLDGDDRSLRRQHGLLLHAEQTPDLHVAGAISALGMDDRRHRD